MFKPRVEVHSEDHALVAEFWDCHRLDPAPVRDLRGKYETHLQAHGNPALVIDLLGVGFAGSAALGLFVTLQKLVRQRGGQIIFCNVEPVVHDSFRISRLVTMFMFAADRAAALAEAARLDADVESDGSPPPEPEPSPLD
jgi:anti-anti-sigma factor